MNAPDRLFRLLPLPAAHPPRDFDDAWGARILFPAALQAIAALPRTGAA